MVVHIVTAEYVYKIWIVAHRKVQVLYNWYCKGPAKTAFPNLTPLLGLM